MSTGETLIRARVCAGTSGISAQVAATGRNLVLVLRRAVCTITLVAFSLRNALHTSAVIITSYME